MEQSTVQSPLQLTLHRRRPNGGRAGGRGSSSRQTSALLPVLFQEMRDARCFYAGNRTGRTNRPGDGPGPGPGPGPGDGDATIVKFQRKFIACISFSRLRFFSAFAQNEIV